MSNKHRNYNAMSNKPKETTYEPTEETLVTEGNVVDDSPSYVAPETAVEPPEEPVYGVVANCDRLNVRSKPTKNSEVVTVIKADMDVAIIPSKSTEDWYYIALWDGYVMKEFIKLK